MPEPDDQERHGTVLTLTDIYTMLCTLNGKIDAIQSNLVDRDHRLRAMVVEAQGIVAVLQALGRSGPAGRT